MTQKHRRHFNITFIISIMVHVFVLTVLFTVPNIDREEYKEVRVRIGKANKTDDITRAKKYAEYMPAAGGQAKKPVAGNSNITSPAQAPIAALQGDIPSPATSKAEEPKDSAEDKKPEEIATPEEPLDKTLAAETKTPAQPGLERVIEQVSKENAAPLKALSAPVKESESEGTILGNTNDKDAGQLVSYEQALPLWLDKFKHYPEEAGKTHLSGTGEIFIKINRQGRVLLSGIQSSTGHELLDKALIKMIEDANPVLPVPDDYIPGKKTFSYKITFTFKEPLQ